MGKEIDDKEEKIYSPIINLAIVLMNKWAQESIRSSENKTNVNKFILKSGEQDILLAYAHIRKFNNFTNERFFHLIGERVSQQDIAFTKDFLRSKLRSNENVKVDVDNTRRR